jgi:hypothetical protein
MSYEYTDRTKAPIKHRHILIKLMVGHNDQEVAAILDCSVELVRKVKNHPCNAEFLRITQLAIQADEEALRLEHDQIVRGSLRLQRATLREAMEDDEDGEPTLRMQTKKDGTMVPVVPASLLKTLMVDPLDHDPAARFTKNLNLQVTKRDKGMGGGFLSQFKQEAISEGFSPPQVIDAEFTVNRDGGAVLESSAVEEIDLTIDGAAQLP